MHVGKVGGGGVEVVEHVAAGKLTEGPGLEVEEAEDAIEGGQAGCLGKEVVLADEEIEKEGEAHGRFGQRCNLRMRSLGFGLVLLLDVMWY